MKARGYLFLAVFLLGFTQGDTKKPPSGIRINVPWAVTDWPPYYDLSPGSEVDGKIEKLKSILQRNLSGYSFVDIQSDVPKTLELMKQNRNICTGSALKTPEREKWAYFTALTFMAPHKYVVVTSNEKLLPRGDTVSFKDLISRKDLKGVLIHDRSYGPFIDSLIHDSPKNITLLNPSGGYLPLLKMVQKGRFDFTIEYEVVVQSYNERNRPLKPVPSQPLKEMSQSAVVWIACTKNKWGKDIVSKIDGVLQKQAGKKEYQNAVESWSDPLQIKKNKKALDDFYHRRAQSWSTINVE